MRKPAKKAFKSKAAEKPALYGGKTSMYEGLEPSTLVLGGLRAPIAPAHQREFRRLLHNINLNTFEGNAEAGAVTVDK